MRFIGLEEINPYKDFYKYKIYKYDDKIELGNKDNFICDLSLIVLNIEEIYLEKGFAKSKAIATVKNINIGINIDEFKKGIVDFILEELSFLDISGENIDIEFIKS